MKAINRAVCVWNCFSHLGQMCSCYDFTYKSRLLEGFRRGRGSILAPQRKLDLQGSCLVANLHSISDSIEKNSSKFQYAVCVSFMGRLASLKGSLHDACMGRSAARG